MFVITQEPDTLEKAFKLAKDAESLQVISDITSDARQSIHALNMPGEIVGRKPDYGQAEVKHELELGELKEELNKLQQQVEKQKPKPQPSQIPRAIRCHYCNIPGHRIAECRKRLREVVQRRQPFVQPAPTSIRGYRFPTARPLSRPPFRPGNRPPAQNGYHAPQPAFKLNASVSKGRANLTDHSWLTSYWDTATPSTVYPAVLYIRHSRGPFNIKCH